MSSLGVEVIDQGSQAWGRAGAQAMYGRVPDVSLIVTPKPPWGWEPALPTPLFQY